MLSDLFNDVISNYEIKKSGYFSKDAFVSKVTESIPNLLKRTLDIGGDYIVKGSVGTGNWAETPWVAILDRNITTTVQKGYYVCYLINPKQKTMYLSLAVGWTQFAERYTAEEAQRRIANYGSYLLSQLKDVPTYFKSGPIDLSAQHALTKGYERGQIISKKYLLNELEDSVLIADLEALLSLYAQLRDIVGSDIQNIDYGKVTTNTKLSESEIIENRKTLKNRPRARGVNDLNKVHQVAVIENSLMNRIAIEDTANAEVITEDTAEQDAENLEEEYLGNALRNLATSSDTGVADTPYDHLQFLKNKLENMSKTQPPERVARVAYHLVRDPKVAMMVKESKQFICEICNRKPFMQKNGKPYAEADHIQPLGGATRGLDTPENMRCLCAQCHAIITHGSNEEIRKLLNQ